MAVTGLIVGGVVAPWALGDVKTMDEIFVLAADGCGRATGYAETNKIVTLDGKTHVTWLDSVAEGFRVRIRTFTHATGQWSPTITVGDAHDNHGGPALAVDSKGYLHIVYYPHHHPFRYRHSLRPNDAAEWSEETQIGERCTYPTLMVGPDDTLCIALTLIPPEGRKAGGSRSWGHASNEVIWLESRDGGTTFDIRTASRADATCANWLPNIERPTGFNRVDRPGLIFTGGTAGKNNLQHVSNRVLWAR